MANNQKKLKAFVRYDGSGRVVASSLILRKNKPRVGRWFEIPTYECCNGSGTTTTTTTQGGGGTPTAWVISYGWTEGQVCGSNPSLIVYTSQSTLGYGVTIYLDAALTQPLPGEYGSYIGDGDNVYSISGGIINNFGVSCSVVPVQKSFYISDMPGTTCGSGSSLSVYTPTNHLVVGNYIYTDAAMTNVYTPNVGTQYLSEVTANPAYKGIFEWNSATGQITFNTGSSC